MEVTELERVSDRFRGVRRGCDRCRAATVAFRPSRALLKTPSGKLRRLPFEPLLAEGESLLWRKDFA